MNSCRVLTCCVFLCLFASHAYAQVGDIIAVDDSICVMAGDPIGYNVKDNDVFPQGFLNPVFLTGPSDCFGMTAEGELYFLPDAGSCCGEHILKYRYEICQPPNVCSANIKIVVKCPKPDCFLVDLTDYLQNGGTAGNPDHPACVPACENSSATYFVPYNPANTYNWSVTGGSYTNGANPAEIIVNWGTAGSGTITLTVTNANGETKTAVICANILPAPVADFQALADSVCLNAPISFINNSSGGNSWFWDFGDGNTSSMFQPTHQYGGPGVYTVTLIVMNSNFDPDGAPLCCCSDTAILDVFVDSLPGPNIYCVSTLCAGDSTKYWTDATGCGSYVWTVLDENGMAISFTGQGTDSICVQWGNGPVGTVSLEVTGCDSAYCDQPVSVLIPIISPTVAINGPDAVCANETATYTVPKWLSVDYNWVVTGGTILSGQGSNTVVIQWGPGPGPGTINLNYASQFLGGLPGHDPEDCAGSAALSVDIKPQFDVVGPPPVVCANSSSSFFATFSPYPNYTWTITPPVSFSGQGTNSITATWDAGPGTFVITATPNDSTVYCNDVVTLVVNVVELVPPASIDGPTDICPGETYTYFAQTAQSGVGFNWTVVNGTPGSFTGNPISVTWGPSGPYSLSVQQFHLGPPFCSSDTIQLQVQPKQINGPITISGPPGCINSVKNYTGGPAQHPDATYTWSISPASAGSVIMGQGTLNAQVQWNNNPGAATLTLTVKLCNDSLAGTLPITLIAPALPNITQTGILCPGVPATLNAGAGFSSYAWSTLATTQTITITTAGTYVVTTTDANTCTAVDSYTAVAVPGPTALISTGNNTVLCINPNNSNTVTINAVTGTGYSFAWYCNNTLQGLPSTQSFLVHTNTNVLGTFLYYVIVTDANGCMSQSNNILVVQDSCTGSGTGCTPEAYSLSFVSANQTPNCNIVDFTVASSGNVTLTGWNFGDPLSNANTGTLAMAQHTYATIGCTKATVFASVPEAAPGTGTCLVAADGPLCIPLVANFSYKDSCQKVSFTDQSTFMAGQGPSSWFWDFGDGNTSTQQNPMHTYATGGAYTVMFTAINSAGCQAKITKTITVVGLPNPAVSAATIPACTGDPVMFMATAPNILSWFWDFDDGAFNGSQNPSHTYLTANNYTVMLTVVDIFGCKNTVQLPVTVNTSPAPDTIAYTDLTICAGDSVQLTAPAGTGYTYLWSTGANTQSIFVSTAGGYSVVVTDANGCTMAPDSVVLTVYPLPIAAIAGPAFICDDGCVTLSAPSGYGYTYQWLDDVLAPIPGAIFNTLSVCDTNLLPAYSVVVTDANGCSAVSAPFPVMLAVSPSFAITVSPDSCEGTPATLTIVPVQPNVVYNWSNGGSGTSITVVQAGLYTAIGTDTLTGCKGSATATIHPLPNLCIVPAGCYEACNPDTICGPDSLAAYQWNLNGVPIAGATGQCLIVTQSGTYSLTGTTEFGCSLTSDSLMLMLIDCGCDELDVWATPSETDSCCWNISYVNNYGSIYGLVIHTGDTGLDFDLGSLSSSLAVYSVSDTSIGLVNALTGQPLPLDTLGNFIKMCFTGVIDSPQIVVFDWYDFGFGIVCSDTLEFNCPVEPDCLYLQSDSIYCDGTQVVYNFTVCNPIDADFPVAYIIITPTSPTGIIVTPTTISEIANPIQPGECRSYSLLLSGTGIENQLFCFSLTAHDRKPSIPIDTSLCCMLDTSYCIEIPDCMPCDDVGVEVVDTLSSENGACCYAITLYNNYAAGAFDGVSLCLLTPGSSMTINNPFGSGWVTNGFAPTMINLDVAPPIGTSIPVGVVQLPVICIKTNQAPPQLLEIKWTLNGNIICRDTIELGCEPPCGYILDETVVCDPAVGGWVFSGSIKNTSAYTMGEAHFVFTSPAGLGVYNFTLPLGSLPPGGTQPFNVVLGAPAMTGDTVCFTVALHEVNDDEMHANCCNFNDCIVLPDCPVTSSCQCDSAFYLTVDQGISYQTALTNYYLYSFAPEGELDECDMITWSWSDTPAPTLSSGNSTVSHLFAQGGVQSVCMMVTRITDDGRYCVQESCSSVEIFTTATENDFTVFPNPSDGRFYALLSTTWDSGVRFRLFDMLGRLRAEQDVPGAAGKHLLPLQFEGLSNGIYLLVAESGGELWSVKIMLE